MKLALGRPRRFAQAAAIVLLALPSGCGYLESKKLLSRYGLEQNDVLLTGAEYRAIVATRVEKGDYRLGHVIPRNIRCAEPSPDIAKAISDALSTAIAAEVTKGTASGQIDVRLSRETSEAFAQLGERLATIQLLRDGLFRACEAYANGAIGAVNYGAILSAYDDLTVTLLAAEMTAGAFGRSLAAASATASGTAAMQVLAAAQRRARELDTEIGRLKTRLTAAKDDEKKLIEEEIEKKGRELEVQNEEVKTLAATAARERERGGTFVSPGGTIAAIRVTDPTAVARVIQAIHAKYLDNDSKRGHGALAMACVNALSRVDGRILKLDQSSAPTFRDDEETGAGKTRSHLYDGYTMFTKLCAQNMPKLMAGTDSDEVRTRLTAIERRLGIRRQQPVTPRGPTRTTPMQPKAEAAPPGKAPMSVTQEQAPIRAMERRTAHSMCMLVAAGV